MSTKFHQMMIVHWLFIFSQQGQICIHLCGKNVEKPFFQNVLKTGRLKLTMHDKSSKIKIYNQNFAPCGLSALAPGLYTCIKSCNLKMSFSLKPLLPDFIWGLLLKRFWQFVQMVLNKVAGKKKKKKNKKKIKKTHTLKNLLQNQESFEAESCLFSSPEPKALPVRRLSLCMSVHTPGTLGG